MRLPIGRIGEALTPHRNAGNVTALAERAHVKPKVLGLLQAGGARALMIAADEYLRVAAALRSDPVTFLAADPPDRPIETIAVDRRQFALAVRMHRIAHGYSLRKAARAFLIGYATVKRIEHGESVSGDSYIAACTALARHPWDFLSVPTRFHVKQACHAPAEAVSA